MYFTNNKIMNVKLFNNGKIFITGLKGIHQAPVLVTNLIEYFKALSIFEEDTNLLSHDLVLINSDFDLGYSINISGYLGNSLKQVIFFIAANGLSRCQY